MASPTHSHIEGAGCGFTVAPHPSFQPGTLMGSGEGVPGARALPALEGEPGSISAAQTSKEARKFTVQELRFTGRKVKGH